LVSKQIGNDLHQSTLMAQVPGGFTKVATESIQVLYANHHWVATACIGSDVLVADSVGGKISPHVADQLKQLYTLN
jgi:hypothetical protein